MAEYTVRLLVKVETDQGPEEAARLLVDNLAVNGIVRWVYRVEEYESGKVLGYYDGFGRPLDIDSPNPLGEPQEIQTPVKTVETVELPEPASDIEPESDQKLLDLAITLNANDQPAPEPDPGNVTE